MNMQMIMFNDCTPAHEQVALIIFIQEIYDTFVQLWEFVETDLEKLHK